MSEPETKVPPALSEILLVMFPIVTLLSSLDPP